MKILYLIRHAKSSWADPSQNDFDRPLNNRGRIDAPRMAKRLKEKGIHPDLLLSSPAERAFATCKLMAEVLRCPDGLVTTERRLYHATPDELKSIVKGLDDASDEVMIFSHNPGLTDFANCLNKKTFTENIPTCGVVAMEFNIDSWKDVIWGAGKLVFFDFPKNENRHL